MGRGSNAFNLLLPLLLVLLLPLKDTRPPSAQTQYDRAMQLFLRGSLAASQQEAESGYQRFRTADRILATKFQLLEAKSMLWRGLYEDALRVLSSYHSPAPPDAGTVEKLAIEAIALSRQQQPRLADQRLTQAETLCRNADISSCGDVLAAQGLLDLRDSRLLDARRRFLQALSFARSHHDAWLQVSTSLNLGYVAMQADHYDEAGEWSQLAYRDAVDLHYETIIQKAAGNLGWANYELGDQERALEQFLAAEKSAAQLGNIGSERGWVSTTGYVYRDMGDWRRAEQSYRRALDLARQINSSDDILKALEDLADVSVLSGKLDEADSYISQVTLFGSGTGSRPNSMLLLVMGKLALARKKYAKAEQYFESVRNDSASLMTTRLNAGYGLAKLYEVQRNTVAAERMYRSTLAEYDSARSQLKSEESQLPFGTNAAQIYDSYVHFLVQEGRSGDALAAADESRARTLEQSLTGMGAKRLILTGTRTIDPRRISRTTQSTLLFYWLGEEQSYLWAITPTKIALLPLPPRQQIATRVERYRKALLDLRDPLESEDADGQALYQMLVAPAAAMIHPNKPVIILDEGILSKLNFETLLVPGPGAVSKPIPVDAATHHYLIDDFTLSSAPSLAMLGVPKSAPDPKSRMLLLGNPVSPSQEFPTLPLFSFEMSRIESHFASGQLSVLGGQQATPAAYAANQPERFSYIHFVSHAVASSTDPLDSAIILSKSGGHEDSYKLYAREIIQHPIDAKLVTISACYGSGTRTYAGEGLVGLSWAFLRAGAHKVIGALWEVSDDSTPRMMDSLYGDLMSGSSPELALHNAKLALLHSQTRFRMPFYWAPFQMYRRQ